MLIPLCDSSKARTWSIFGSRDRMFWWHTFKPFESNNSERLLSLGYAVFSLSLTCSVTTSSPSLQLLQHLLSSNEIPIHFRWKRPLHAWHEVSPWFLRIVLRQSEHKGRLAWFTGPGLSDISPACIKIPAATKKFTSLINCPGLPSLKVVLRSRFRSRGKPSSRNEISLALKSLVTAIDLIRFTET